MTGGEGEGGEGEGENCHMLITSLFNEGAVIKREKKTLLIIGVVMVYGFTNCGHHSSRTSMGMLLFAKFTVCEFCL